MFTKIWLPLLIVASVINASPSPTPQYSSPQPPRAGAGYYPSSSQRPVYTAQRAREHYSPSQYEDDDPYPSTSNLGTAQTTHGAEEPENTGFVQEPIDFSNLLKGVGSSSSKGLDISGSANNPLFASESKNSFAGFFGKNKDPFADFGTLATASSDRNPKSPDNEDPAGFVDPNVQFRSLFESSQAANNGFKPEDFLGNQGDSSGVEPSKGSQTQSFPSFTYSGRKEDDYGSNDNPKYRSNYRQVESSDDDYSPSYRGGGGGGGGREEPSYDDDRDRNGYGRSYSDDSNSGPPNRSGPPPSNSRYNQESESPRYSPATEETSHRPQASGQRPKTAESSNKSPKCKKVEKNVDYSNNEDYTSFTEPEQDYDPSTYRGRYKRQSRQSSRGNKRPMTCYVCEDEQGRYAEKCSYDSKANPNKNEYFHSSSSAYSDNGNGNGRRQSGKSDRQRRNPNRQGQRAEASATTSTSAEPQSSVDGKETRHEIEESEPKILEKRQAGGGDRYASNFGGSGRRGAGGRGGGAGGNNEFEFNNAGNGDYGLPRGYLGNNGGRVNEFDSPQGRPVGNNNQNREAGGDNYGLGGNDNNDREYEFDNNNNGRELNDFNFGAPRDFGRESSQSGSGSRGSGARGGDEQGFNNFDFTIPRDYDPDVQLSNSNGNNNNNRASTDGSASSSSNRDSFPNNFDVGYDDYVKQYFPDAFGPSESSSVGPSRSSSPSFSPSSGSTISSSPPSYRTRTSPRENSFNQYNNRNDRPHHHRSSSPDKEHTQPSHNFAPPPNFFNNNPEGFENSQNLHKIMDNFSGKDRSNCQKVQKGDMSCYVCRDAKGMNKEECMYASNDPKNTRMAYHEVTEYSSDPPASILPLPRPETSHASSSSPGGSLQQAGSAPVASSVSKTSVQSSSPPTSSASSVNFKSKTKPSSITRVESKIVSTKIHHENKSPIEYDFDY